MPKPDAPSARAAMPPDARRLLLARGLRGMADGYMAVLLPAYLLALDFGTADVGLIATARVHKAEPSRVAVAMRPTSAVPKPSASR